MLMGWSRQLDQVANTVIEAWQLHTSRRWNVEFPATVTIGIRR